MKISVGDVLFVKWQEVPFNLLRDRASERFFSETEIPNLVWDQVQSPPQESHTQQHGGHMLPGQEQQGSHQDSVQRLQEEAGEVGTNH